MRAVCLHSYCIFVAPLVRSQTASPSFPLNVNVNIYRNSNEVATSSFAFDLKIRIIGDSSGKTQKKKSTVCRISCTGCFLSVVRHPIRTDVAKVSPHNTFYYLVYSPTGLHILDSWRSWAFILLYQLKQPCYLFFGKGTVRLSKTTAIVLSSNAALYGNMLPVLPSMFASIFTDRSEWFLMASFFFFYDDTHETKSVICGTTIKW